MAKKLNLARLIYNAYPGSDSIPISPSHLRSLDELQEAAHRLDEAGEGDELFHFVVDEVVEAGLTREGEIRIPLARQALERAVEQMQAVVDALRAVE